MKKAIALLLFISLLVLKAEGQNWVPVFSDDFNGDSLNTKIWRIGYPWGAVNNTNTYMLKKNISVSHGQLILRALHEKYNDNGITRTNTSGTISSFVGFQRGAFAIRFKASSLFWPAFWIYGAEGNEIDFFELGNDCHPFLGVCTVDRTKMALIGTKMGGGHWYNVNKDWSNDWHVIGGNWDGNVVDMYIDGVYMDTYKANYKHDLGIIIDLEVNDENHSALHTKLPAEADFPSYMYVDWVRAWAPVACESKKYICRLDDEKDHIITGGTVNISQFGPNAACGNVPCSPGNSCEVSVTSGQQLNIYATKEITLNPGFSVTRDPAQPLNDASFSAEIVKCSPNTNGFEQNGFSNHSTINSDSADPPFNWIRGDLIVNPNPGNGIFKVKILNVNENLGGKMVVLNALGEVILLENFENTNSIKCDLTNYRSGIYFIRVIIDNQQMVQKIMRL